MQSGEIIKKVSRIFGDAMEIDTFSLSRSPVLLLVLVFSFFFCPTTKPEFITDQSHAVSVNISFLENVGKHKPVPGLD